MATVIKVPLNENQMASSVQVGVKRGRDQADASMIESTIETKRQKVGDQKDKANPEAGALSAQI